MLATWQLSREFDGAAFDANRRRVAAMYKAMFDQVGLPLDDKLLAMAKQHGAPAELWPPPHALRRIKTVGTGDRVKKKQRAAHPNFAKNLPKVGPGRPGKHDTSVSM